MATAIVTRYPWRRARNHGGSSSQDLDEQHPGIGQRAREGDDDRRRPPVQTAPTVGGERDAGHREQDRCAETERTADDDRDPRRPATLLADGPAACPALERGDDRERGAR